MRNDVFGGVFAIRKSGVSRRVSLPVGLLGLTALGLSLGACGGGGGGSSPDPDPKPDNKAPKFADDVVKTVSVVENMAITEAVGTFTATDEDEGDVIVYSLKGDDSSLFAISDKGELKFRTAPDYETPTDTDTDNVYKVTVVATGGEGDRAKSVEYALTVTVTDEVNESPRFAEGLSGTSSVSENQTVVGTYTATDEDKEDTVVIYSLSGDDADLFAISDEGELTFVTAPDYETPTDTDGDNVYNVTIVATGGEGDRAKTAEHALTITVTDESDNAPEFEEGVKARVEVTENAANSQVVGTFTASDADEDDKITYSLQGTDKGSFNIDSSSGEVTFKAVPDYEDAKDKDTDNVYNVTVVATDKAGAKAEHALTVTVKNDLTDDGEEVNHSPNFAEGLSGTASVSENTQAVGTYTATDADKDDEVSYSLDGADKALFAISESGVLTFVTTPDYEDAKDDGGDNVYNVTIVASSGAGDRVKTAEHALEVTVTDENDNAPKFADGLLGTASVKENQTAVGRLIRRPMQMPATQLATA